jgi:hypothetical protein
VEGHLGEQGLDCSEFRCRPCAQWTSLAGRPIHCSSGGFGGTEWSYKIWADLAGVPTRGSTTDAPTFNERNSGTALMDLARHCKPNNSAPDDDDVARNLSVA